ncbi:hypothetical protein DUI87_34755 [Hirundo rustica rustica]|uniref:MHC class I-like antigen recognition-like domain-containing protein n=1 Tax=Hirundo rustica rustica TaxID=333673 RepID=A0A3M0IHD7_HIRRU|nr:hypothetical protein DUI87_34755 [Hirundo rustica rustica]
MLPGLGGFVLGSVCLGWGSASAAGEAPDPAPAPPLEGFGEPPWPPGIPIPGHWDPHISFPSSGDPLHPLILHRHSLNPLSRGSIRGSHRIGSDGREFLSFQPGSGRFVVAAGAAQVTKRRWEHEKIQAEE